MNLEEFKSEIESEMQDLARSQDHLNGLYGKCSQDEARKLDVQIAGIGTHYDALKFVLSALNQLRSIRPIQVPTSEENQAHQNIILGLQRRADAYATGRQVLAAADNFLVGAQVIANGIVARYKAAA